MNLQFALKLLLASSAAACCVATAQAQIVDGEITATISSLLGPGWGSGNIGQSVTLDLAYDSSQQTQSFNNGIFSVSSPLTSASIVGGPFGSGTNLEPNGPGSGTIAEDANKLPLRARRPSLPAPNHPAPDSRAMCSECPSLPTESIPVGRGARCLRRRKTRSTGLGRSDPIECQSRAGRRPSARDRSGLHSQCPDPADRRACGNTWKEVCQGARRLMAGAPSRSLEDKS